MHRQASRPRLSQAARQPAVQQLIEQMMSVEPAGRPPTPTALIQAIETLLLQVAADDPATASTALQISATELMPMPALATIAATAPGQPTSPTRSGRRGWIAISLPIGLAAIGAGVWLWPQHAPLDSTVAGPTTSPPSGSEPPVASSAPPRARDDLHGQVVALPEGRARIAYDFQSQAQLEDFEPVGAEVRSTILDGRLQVELADPKGAADLAVVLHRQPMRVDRLTFEAELVAGDHINWYVQTVWKPNEWCPELGYAGVHRGDGRLLCLAGQEPPSGEGPSVEPGLQYRVTVDLDGAQLRWQENDDARTRIVRTYRGTDRRWGLGTYRSRVAFDNVQVEGVLAP
jgi:hypothetical protein